MAEDMGNRKWCWKYTKETERTFFFYATVAMLILWVLGRFV